MCGQITMGCMSPPESNSIETRRLQQQQHSRHIPAPQFISEPTTNPRWLAELTARKELSAGAFDARQETVKLINHGHMHLNAIWQINHSSLVYWWGGCQIDVCSLHKLKLWIFYHQHDYMEWGILSSVMDVPSRPCCWMLCVALKGGHRKIPDKL